MKVNEVAQIHDLLSSAAPFRPPPPQISNCRALLLERGKSCNFQKMQGNKGPPSLDTCRKPSPMSACSLRSRGTLGEFPPPALAKLHPCLTSPISQGNKRLFIKLSDYCPIIRTQTSSKVGSWRTKMLRVLKKASTRSCSRDSLKRISTKRLFSRVSTETIACKTSVCSNRSEETIGQQEPLDYFVSHEATNCRSLCTILY